MTMDKHVIYDRILGSLVAGAAGDALGYQVEFMDITSIKARYGARGVTGYVEPRGGLISDDTQMTLFTAEGLATASNRGYIESIYHAYLDWLDTQKPLSDYQPYTKLYSDRRLHANRAPGKTCVSALRRGRMGTMEAPLNSSKGCGGVMRVAPIGLFFPPEDLPIEETMRLGAQAAAITHGHPLGYYSAAAQVFMVNRLAYGSEQSIDRLAGECAGKLTDVFGENEDIAIMRGLIEKTSALAHSGLSDLEAIDQLGGGWVGEEAFAIALLCVIRHWGDLEETLIAAVNHSGDSDSTGAVAGNMAGAALGATAISSALTEGLEANDLYTNYARILARQ